jgi:hypothetical protein
MSAGIYRTTEDGNQRVLENSVDLRVTENYVEGLASITASSSISAIPSITRFVASTLNASSSISASSNVFKSVSTQLQAVGSIQATSKVNLVVTSNLTGVSSMLNTSTLITNAATSLGATSNISSFAGLILPSNTSLNATSESTFTAGLIQPVVFNAASTSALIANGQRTTAGSTALISFGNLTSVPTYKGNAITSLVSSSTCISNGRIIKNATVLSGILEFDRITEEDDTRITEDDDVRITNFIPTNIIESAIVANADLTPFSSVAYIKVNGNWETVFDVNANVEGVWKDTDKIYRNIAGTWKRIY